MAELQHWPWKRPGITLPYGTSKRRAMIENLVKQELSESRATPNPRQ
jgi:hypothetical protein